MRQFAIVTDPETGAQVRIPVIMGAAHGSSDQVATQWAQRLASSGDKITQGVQSVKVAPGQAAAGQKAAWLNQLNASADKWARNVARVGLSDWQNSMTTKGIPRIASGASAAEPKFAQFLGKFLPYIDNAKSSLPARGSYEANKARMVAFIDKVHQFKA